MLGGARRVVRKAERFHHLHLLLDEAHHLLRGALGGDGPEGEMVDAREFRREHRQRVRIPQIKLTSIRISARRLNSPSTIPLML